MSAGVRYNPAFRTLGKALIFLLSRIHAVGLSVKPQTRRTLVRLLMTWPRVRLLAEKNRISARTIALSSKAAIEHTVGKWLSNSITNIFQLQADQRQIGLREYRIPNMPSA